MKIEHIAAAFPSRKVTNEDILELIRAASSDSFGELQKILKYVQRALKTSGSDSRYWLGEGESSLGITVQACKKAMSGLNDDDPIDLLIVASVYPELMEPATANIIAHEIGFDYVECFDVKEACDGWMKAVKIASAFIESGMYRRIMVVNGEFVMSPGFGIYPNLFSISKPEEVEWRFPAFTLGEAATAMIIGPDEDNKWNFTNHTRNDLFDLCSITSVTSRMTCRIIMC